MNDSLRSVFKYLLIVTAIAGLVWAMMFEKTPPAEFAFQNSGDIKSADPAKAEGNVEQKFLDAVFEGLLKMHPVGSPDPVTGMQPMTPQPGMAESYQVSEDGKTYTFKIRRDAKWTDGSRVTSYDFAWSWRRTLHPETANTYTLHFGGIPFANQYNLGQVDVGERIEVELDDRPDPAQTFPRGTIVYGVVEEILKGTEPDFSAPLPEEPGARDAEKKRRAKLSADWQAKWVYRVREIQPSTPNEIEDADEPGRMHEPFVQNVDWEDRSGPIRTFVTSADSSNVPPGQTAERCLNLMVAFSKLGAVETPDAETLIVRLKNAIPYFPDLVAFYVLMPVNRQCVEKYGSPYWTKPENIVSNGPFKMQFRRLRDRIRIRRNPLYYDVENVGMETIDIVAVTRAT
ncbi:MAG: ABC transporter substrate-binding protein, partial [Planctomycetota bacterium]